MKTLCIALLCASAASASPIRIDFTAFPGADKILGTADDIPVNLLPNGFTTFTHEYAFLAGGTGVTVDSLCCDNPGAEAVIANVSNRNAAVQFDPNVTPTFALGELAFDLVSSTDGFTPVTVRSVDIRLTPGSTGTILFVNGRDDLRASFTVPSDGSTNVLYSDEDGLARVIFQGTGAVDLFEFDTEGPLSASPPEVAPEPGSLTLAGFAALLLIGARRAAAA